MGDGLNAGNVLPTLSSPGAFVLNQEAWTWAEFAKVKCACTFCS